MVEAEGLLTRGGSRVRRPCSLAETRWATIEALVIEVTKPADLIHNLGPIGQDPFALHPFGDGNTRATTTFVALVARHAGGTSRGATPTCSAATSSFAMRTRPRDPRAAGDSSRCSRRSSRRCSVRPRTRHRTLHVHCCATKPSAGRTKHASCMSRMRSSRATAAHLRNDGQRTSRSTRDRDRLHVVVSPRPT